jgi:hypothetical protein
MRHVDKPVRGQVQSPDSNRNKVRIEIAVTYSRQRIGTNSNRNYSRGPCNSFFSVFRRRRGVPVGLGARQNWRQNGVDMISYAIEP